jgi:molybdate transport system substrate-binding protein
MTKKHASLSTVVLLIFSLFLVACGDPTATTAPTSTVRPDVTTAPTTAITTAAATAAPATAATTASASGEIIVFAAASLTDPFNEIKGEMEKANPGLKITFNFGGSNTLRAQLEQGAKADVFASANQTEMDKAFEAKLVDNKGETFVKNRLVVVLPRTNPGKIEKLLDLARPGLKFVTAQKDVPVGTYTIQALEKMSKDPAYGSEFQTKVEANIVSREANVKQVVSKVQLGEADAGIVYLSDISAKIAPEVLTLDIPDQFNTLATYPIALLKAAPNVAAAKIFLDFVLSAKGQEILKKNNFIPAR